MIEGFRSPSRVIVQRSMRLEARAMSRSRTITKAEWLHNPHAGEMLVSEFMEPLALDATMLAAAIGVPASALKAVIEGTRPLDAELDLRLARYFRMSEGFFLGLQSDYELLEANARSRTSSTGSFPARPERARP